MRTIPVTLLLTLALAAPAEAAVRASGQLSGSGPSYRLVLTNTGDETINCMAYRTPSGESVLAVSGPGDPVTTGAGFTVGDQLGIAPGATAEWAIALDRSVPDLLGGTLDVSSVCILGSDTSSQVGGPEGADLTVDLYTSASYTPPDSFPEDARGKVTVVEYVQITNRGPRDSPGGTLTYTFPPRAERIRGDKPRNPGDPPVPLSVTISSGPTRVGAKREVAMLIYRVRPDSGEHLSSVVVNGINDPTTPDTDRASVTFDVPVATFLPPSFGNDRLRPGVDFRLFGTAAPPRGPGSSRALPPRLDPARAARLRRVEVAVLRLEPTGRERPLAPACQWLRGLRGGFRRIVPARGRCDRAVWLPAAGIAKWSVRLPNGLPAGRYVAYVRAVNGLGVSDGSFSGKKRNRVVLVVG